jgi:hypothetical protein
VTAAQQEEPMNWRRVRSGTADFLLMGGRKFLGTRRCSERGCFAALGMKH